MTTTSLSEAADLLSAMIGTRLVFVRVHGDPRVNVVFRFEDLPELETFSLSMRRSWKATEIRFQADSFSQGTIAHICKELARKQVAINDFIRKNRFAYSELSISIDKRDFATSEPSLLGDGRAFEFELDVLTETSALEHGILNSDEFELLSFAVRFFVHLLAATTKRFVNPDEVLGFPEGASTTVEVNRYERDSRNRNMALGIHGYSCQVCDFNFANTYGSLGEGYAIVHHVIPVSRLGNNYVLNPESDLAVVCANCHCMLHAEDPPLFPAELKQRIKSHHPR